MIEAAHEALAGVRRAPLLILISILSIGLGLFIIGLFGLVAYNLGQALVDLEQRIEVVAYLQDEISPGEIRQLETQIRAMPEVAELSFISKESALAIARREIPEFSELLAGAEVNPLPASFEIRVAPAARNPEGTKLLASRLGALPAVEEVVWGRDWIAHIAAIRRIGTAATLILGSAFALVAAIIIATAIRIAISARQEEIELMRIVGATDAFIRRPFLIEGVVAGLAGGALAVLLTYSGYRVVDRALIEMRWLPAGWIGAALLAGTLWGLLASGITLRRHLPRE